MKRRIFLKQSAYLLTALAGRAPGARDQFEPRAAAVTPTPMIDRLTAVPPLQPQGTVAVIAPAGPAIDKVDQISPWLKSRGYRPRVFGGCLQDIGYLAGNDETRLKDLHAAFADQEIDAIICLRGGYGSSRLLDRIDFKLLRSHPKPFVGYSDITALHLAIARHSGFVTFHGPMLASDFIPAKKEPTEAALFDLLHGRVQAGQWLTYPVVYPPTTLVHGSAQGRLVGGNLSLICATLGTPYEIDTRDAILFIEENGECPYRIDRLLTQLRLAGKLKGLRGALLGSFTTPNQASNDIIDSSKLTPLFTQIFGLLNIPVLSGWRSGHCNPNLTLPLGAMVTLDADVQRIRLEQNVVTEQPPASC